MLDKKEYTPPMTNTVRMEEEIDMSSGYGGVPELGTFIGNLPIIDTTKIIAINCNL